MGVFHPIDCLEQILIFQLYPNYKGKNMKIRLLLLLIVLISCASKTDLPKTEKNDYNQQAILLGDSAVKIMFDVMYDENVPDSIINKSLSMINQAIELEPNVYTYKHNKLLILIDLKRYNEALTYIDSIYKLNLEYLPIIIDQAYLYKQMMKKEESMQKYKEAVNKIDELLDTDSLNIELFLLKINMIISTEDTLRAAEYFQINKNKYKDSTHKIQRFQEYFDFIMKK
jgi:tetratricopeptide (TPR) repeat protein